MKNKVIPYWAIRLIIGGTLIICFFAALFAGGLAIWAHHEGYTWLQAFNIVWAVIFK